MSYRPQDYYSRKARREQFAARSIYKLEEIDRRFPLLHRGDKVLDLGCAPGSWMQYAGQAIGPSGIVVGVDLQPLRIAVPPNGRFILSDIFKLDWKELLDAAEAEAFDVVLSDMAPKTTGVRVTDQSRSEALAHRAFEIARELLRRGGSFCVKVFQGEGFQVLLSEIRRSFKEVRVFRPQSTRKSSQEVFIAARGFTQYPIQQILPDR